MNLRGESTVNSELDNVEKELKRLNEQTAALEYQKSQLEKEKLYFKLVENARKLEKLVENKDFVLSLVQHSRTSCSDSDPCNGIVESTGSYRCPRCALIEILNGCFKDEYAVDFDVTITKVS